MDGPRGRGDALAYGPPLGWRNAGLAIVIAGAALLPALAAAEAVTVAALGDSLTAGYGLTPPEGFVPQLQAWLDERGADAVVVNAGVSGDTTAGGLARLDWALGGEVDALILALGGNDFLRGVEPSVSRSNLRGILEAADARGIETLVVGIRASANYGPDYQRDFDAMFTDLSAEFGALLEPDWFAALRPDGGSLADALDRTMQPDGIHPNAEGVRLIVERIGPRVLELVAEAQAEEAAG